MEVCRERGIRVGTTCVLSAQNLDTVDELLEFISEQGVICMFQPATKWLDSGTDPNPIAPETEAYRRTIDKLVARKRAGAPIANSVAGLKILRKWPEPTTIRSTAGGITCTVEPDGKVLASHLTETASLEAPREDQRPPWELFRDMPVLKSNSQPWCAPILELDLLFALNPSAMLNAFKVQR
jgi:MoaA/NifB/PqqE/SkfB family radical SAM enzyme